MYHSTAVVAYFPSAMLNTLDEDKFKTFVKKNVEMLVATPVSDLSQRHFNKCLTQGKDARDTLDAIVTGLAKSKKTEQHHKIAARIQTFLGDTFLKEYNVKARIDEVWDEQQAAYERLTPEELEAYNALTPEELAEHCF